MNVIVTVFVHRRSPILLCRIPAPFGRGWQSLQISGSLFHYTRQTYSCRSTTRPRTFPPLFKSLSAALAWSADRVSIGIGGTLPA